MRQISGPNMPAGPTPGLQTKPKKRVRRAHRLGPFSALKHLLDPDRRTKIARLQAEQYRGLVAQTGGAPSASQELLIKQIMETTWRIDLMQKDMACSEDIAIWKFQELSARQAALLAYIKEFHAACPPPPPAAAQSDFSGLAGGARAKLFGMLDRAGDVDALRQHVLDELVESGERLRVQRAGVVAGVGTPQDHAGDAASAATPGQDSAQTPPVAADTQAPAEPAVAPAKPAPVADGKRWSPPPWATPWDGER